MFASDVILKLQRLIEKHGDVPVIYFDDGTRYVVSEIIHERTHYIRHYYEPERPIDKPVFSIS